jgi:hypothetical protein
MILIKNNFNNYKLVEFDKGKAEIQNPYIIPNVAAIARQMTGGSQIMMIVKRLLSLKPFNIIKFGLNNVTFALSILKMDFAAGVKVLCELEIIKALEREKTNHFVLHNQMVDMALAFNNRKVLNMFFYLGKKYNFVPGIISYNPVKMIKFLSGFAKLPEGLVVYTPMSIVDKNIVDVMKSSNICFESIGG